MTLDDALRMGSSSTIGRDTLVVVRLLLLALALRTMWWAACLTWAMARGDWALRAVYRAAWFFFSMGTVAFQAFAIFSTPNDATRLGSTLILLIGFGLAQCAIRLSPRYDQLHRALDHIGEAMALVDLARVDRAAALAIADECRRLTAERLIRGS